MKFDHFLCSISAVLALISCPADAQEPALDTQSFQIGQERAGHVLAVVEPDGSRHYLCPDLKFAWWTNYTWNFLGWTSNGTQSRYQFNFFLGEVDTNQPEWSLVDETTGEDFGETHQVFIGFTPP